MKLNITICAFYGLTEEKNLTEHPIRNDFDGVTVIKQT